MHRFVLATSFAIVGWFTALTSSAAVLYVDKAASGQNDGTSWADAFNHLQDALAAAQDGDELWVAHGTYRPSEGSGSSSRDERFLIPGQVEVYGGFTGTETARDQRVLEGRPQTILEGDDHHYTVAETVPRSVLDGVRITGGRADGDVQRGGGLYSRGGLIRNCLIFGNYAQLFGGGVYAESGLFVNCDFHRNEVGRFGGGVTVAKRSWSGPSFIGCRFIANVSESGGGAYVLTGATSFYNCLFVGNTARSWGGGAAIVDGTHFINCTLYRNTATILGGGVAALLSSEIFFSTGDGLVLHNSILWDNQSIADADSLVSNLLIRKSFVEPVSVRWSCAPELDAAYPDAGNIAENPHFAAAPTGRSVWRPSFDYGLASNSPCLDAGNNDALPRDWADLDGDGITSDEPLPYDLSNAPRIVDDGAARVDMGALEGVAAGIVLPVRHVLLAEGQVTAFEIALSRPPAESATVTVNPPAGVVIEGSAAVTFTPADYAQVQTVMLRAENDDDLADETLELNLTVSGLDTQFSRFSFPLTVQDATNVPARLYVDANADGDGSSWGNALSSLSAALLIAEQRPRDVEEIWVAAGTYRPAGLGRSATFALRSGLKVYGGFVGGETSPSQRDLSDPASVTRLSGDLQDNDQPDFNRRLDNAYHVVTSRGTDADTLLDGFTISGGAAESVPPPDDRGGGLNTIGSAMTVRNCIFEDNQAPFGGGMANWSGQGIGVEDCTFRHNRSFSNGAGVDNYSTDGAFIRCRFNENDANEAGGGMSNGEGFIDLVDCTFVENIAAQGGGLWASGTEGTVRRSRFIRNGADRDGGGAKHEASDETDYVYCVFEGNQAADGAGLALLSREDQGIWLTKFVGNVASNNGGGLFAPFSFRARIRVISSLFEGNQAGNFGGAAFFNGARSDMPLLSHNTIVGNKAHAGGGLYLDGDPEATSSGLFVLEGSIVRDNWASAALGRAAQLTSNMHPDTLIIEDNAITDGTDSALLTLSVHARGNTAAAPRFLKAGYWHGDDENATWVPGDYRLRPDSPYIDQGRGIVEDAADVDQDGDRTEPLPLDLRGDERIRDEPEIPNKSDLSYADYPLDLGAYEMRVWGDLNCDGVLDFFDIEPFATVLTDRPLYESRYPACDPALADCDGDGDVDHRDIEPFVRLLIGD